MFELQLIEKIKRRLNQNNDPNLIFGVGDDCAVFNGANESWLISTDTLVQGRHFDLEYHPAFELGCKALSVNLSDIAAMGGVPKFATVSLTITNKVNAQWADQFLDGICSTLDAYKLNLIGGDTVSGNELSITVTILGTATNPVYRNGAKVEDSIYVSGYLGNSGGGLYLLQKLKNNSPLTNRAEITKSYTKLIADHLNPQPQVELGKLLASSGKITSMQDISDGIATDLSHLARASGVAAVIYEKNIPIHSELKIFAKENDLSPLDLALKAGEDYQLVFTVSAGQEDEFEIEKLVRENGFKISKVGKITSGKGEVTLLKDDGSKENITFQGFEHR